mmetsp:Transcript_22629/g.54655  ORF Transcript_22629/g.54655 Transcript_22629/m.54655 type:complete len:207 (-) Transcript_22629:38-658(-)
MRNIESAIRGSLQGTEDTAAGGGGLASDIKEGAERTLVLVDLINVVSGLAIGGGDDVAINLVVALVNVVQSYLLEETARDQQSRAVARGVVLETDGQSVAGELVRARRGEDAIAIDEGVRDLADDLTVREAHDEAVLGGLVLVLGLAAQALALTVVGLTLTATPVFDLVALVVRFGLCDSNEHHLDNKLNENKLRRVIVLRELKLG